MLRRVVALVAMMLTVYPTYAQLDESVLIGGDTLTYRYIPVDQTHVGRYAPNVESGRSILDYLTFGDRELNPGVSFTILGAPFYNEERGWGLTLGGDMRYRTPRMTEADGLSTLSLRLSASLKGSYAVEVDGRNNLGGNRHRVSYAVTYASQPTYVWGLSFDEARGGDRGRYVANICHVEGGYGYRVTQSLEVGAQLEYLGFSASKLSKRGAEVLQGEVEALSMVGVGVDIVYDTRRAEGYSTRGLNVAAAYTLRSYPFDHIPMGHNATLQFDYYQPLWRGATLLFDLFGEYNSANTPWMLRATMGGGTVMRGYYEGRYMGDNLISAQAELSQHIWQGLGVAAWGGAGVLFSKDDPFEWRKVLPTYGIGLRWGVGGGASLSIDVAFGKGSQAVIVGFSKGL